jgi:hypothetical protein
MGEKEISEPLTCFSRPQRLGLHMISQHQLLGIRTKMHALGDQLDTYMIPSQRMGGVPYQVNGRCTCPDWLHNGVPGV